MALERGWREGWEHGTQLTALFSCTALCDFVGDFGTGRTCVLSCPLEIREMLSLSFAI
jgi:hypothetical protein